MLLYGLLISYCMGSFLNVVISRLPIILRQQWRHQCIDSCTLYLPGTFTKSGAFNLYYPASHCPHCKHILTWHEKIPLFSFILQQGYCRNCQQKIPKRYFYVELITVVLSALLITKNVSPLMLIAGLLFTWYLIALAVIDWEKLLLPDILTWPLLSLGLLCNSQALFVDADNAILGGLAGFFALSSIAKLYHVVSGKIGLGGGDSKLLAAIGAWLGWEMLTPVLLLASGSALLSLLLLYVFKRDTKRWIPFGPYLAASAWGIFYHNYF